MDKPERFPYLVNEDYLLFAIMYVTALFLL